MEGTASTFTYAELTADKVVSTNSIKIFNIIIGNKSTSNLTVNFEDSSGNTILTIAVSDRKFFEFRGAWLAENGLTIKAVSELVYCTIFHSAIGV